MIPALHLVTDDAVIADPSFVRRARAAILEGGSGVAFHLRGPGSSGRAMVEAGRELRAVARSAGATFLVNDRIDVAMLLEADGVHLGGRSLGVSVARGLLGDAALIGRSVHDAGEADAAAGADYLFVGPVYPTRSHPEAVSRGLDVIADVLGSTPGTPVMAIGGITAERAADVVRTGAAGVAVIGAWWCAADPREAVIGLERGLGLGRAVGPRAR